MREVDTAFRYNPIRLVPHASGPLQGHPQRLSRPLVFNYGAFPRTWMNPAVRRRSYRPPPSQYPTASKHAKRTNYAVL